jgi:hypothetical protein
MTGWSMQNSAAVAAADDFSGIGTLMDGSGGHGYLLATILKANPPLRGILFERPEVVAGAKARIAAEGLTDRFWVVAGDCFASVPDGADACILKSMIHDPATIPTSASWSTWRCSSWLAATSAPRPSSATSSPPPDSD